MNEDYLGTSHNPLCKARFPSLAEILPFNLGERNTWIQLFETQDA